MAKLCDHIDSLDWNEAIDLVRKIKAPSRVSGAPDLAELLAAGSQHFPDERFLRLDYSYGDLIVKKGLFQAPGGMDCTECLRLQERCTDSVPLLLTLDKNLEIFFVCVDQRIPVQGTELPADRSYRTVPVRTRTPGESIGLFENLRTLISRRPHYGSFYVSAGSRGVHVVLPLKVKLSLLSDVLPAQRGNPLKQYTHVDLVQYLTEAERSEGPKTENIAIDWHLVREASRAQREATGADTWTASVLLFPERIVAAALQGENKDDCLDWQNRLLFRLLWEAWDQVQDALGAFVQDDSETELLKKSWPVLNIDDVSTVAVLRHLVAAMDGNALVHCLPQNDLNGPFPEFLNWITDRIENNLPLVFEPALLQQELDWGIFSFWHPLVPTSLRIKYLRDSYPDLAEGLLEQLKVLDVTGHAELHGPRKTGIQDLIFGQLPRYCQAMGIALPKRAQLSRDCPFLDTPCAWCVAIKYRGTASRKMTVV